MILPTAKLAIRRSVIVFSALVMTAMPMFSMPVAHAANVSINVNGSQRFQTIEGFGVNINAHSWDNGELRPALDMLIDQNGSKIFRVVMEMTDWEQTNDNADPNSYNWAYYNPIYSGTNFEEVWSTIDYLKQKGIPSSNIILSFMGIGPTWMGGTSLSYAQEDEWVEQVVSAAYYGYSVRGATFGMFSPNNEQDLGHNEGIAMDPSQYARVMNRVAQRLDTLGLSSVRLGSPETSSTCGGSRDYWQQMITYPILMSKIDHIMLHNYSADACGADAAVKASAYPNNSLWITEFSIYDQALSFLEQNATGLLVWDGYDSVYQHAILNGLGSQPGNDAGNAPALLSYSTTTRTYTPRKEFYMFSQLFKYVPIGAVRVGASSSNSAVSSLAFQDSATGRVTVVGRNTSSSSQTLTIALNNLGTNPTALQYFQTNSSSNMAQGANVAVSGGIATVTVPANTEFTLTGISGPSSDTTPPSTSLTSPTGGATLSGSTTVSATASDNVAVSGVQFKLDGTNLSAEDTTAPYSISWNTTSVANGSHTLTAIARDTSGNTTTSSGVVVTVSNSTSGNGSLLIGDQTVQSFADNNVAGSAEAFKYAATATGQSGKLSLYIDSGSTATGVAVGVYSDNNNHPGALLTSGTINTPQSAAWNTVTLNTNPILTQGTAYWIGFLGTGGTLNYRDQGAGNCSESTSSSNLTALPASWASGSVWPTCNLSAYVTSLGSTDTTAPTTPTGLGAVSGGVSQVQLNWDASTDNVGVVGYHIWRNGSQVSSTTVTAFSDAGLTPATAYSYTVSAFDGAGNESPQSSPVAVTTASDTSAPTAPSGLSITNTTKTSVAVSWAASTDNVGVTGYGYYIGNQPLSGTTTSTSTTFSNLTCQTDYPIAIDAFDAAGNRSSKSTITITTTPCSDTTPPSTSLTSPTGGATLSGSTTVSATASDNVAVSGVQFKLDGTNLSAEDTTAPYSISWNTTSVANGSHTLTAIARDTSGNTTTSSGVVVTVSNSTTSQITLDKTVTTHQSAKATSISSPSLTTSQPNELLVAFITSDGPTSGTQSFKTVTGGGLTWTLAKRVNTQAGTSEIWTAAAPSIVSNAIVKATRSSGSYVGSVTVAAFVGASTSTIGALSGSNAATGTPSTSLTATRTGSVVWGVGNDWDQAVARTAGSGQTLVDQYLANVGDTFWVQKLNSTTTAGQVVTISDTAPVFDRWNLVAVEILPKP